MGKVRQATRKPLVAWLLTGSVLVVLVAALVLLALNASRLNASRLDAGQIGLYGLLSAGVLAYAGAGGLGAQINTDIAFKSNIALAGALAVLLALALDLVLLGAERAVSPWQRRAA